MPEKTNVEEIRAAREAQKNKIKFLAAEVLREAGLAGANEDVQRGFLTKFQLPGYSSGIGLTEAQKKYVEAIKQMPPNPDVRPKGRI